jgi:hypothetical protein
VCDYALSKEQKYVRERDRERVSPLVGHKFFSLNSTSFHAGPVQHPLDLWAQLKFDILRIAMCISLNIFLMRTHCFTVKSRLLFNQVKTYKMYFKYIKIKLCDLLMQFRIFFFAQKGIVKD